MRRSTLTSKTIGLNLDILQTTIDFVDERSDVLMLSLVSSSVRSMAVRRLLSMAPIQLKGESSIRHFHAFLFVDAQMRGSHVRALNILTSRLNKEPNRQEIESLLCQILSISRNLHTLSLPDYVAPPAGSESALRVALEGLRTLRELHVRGYHDNAPHTLVQRIRSPVHTLRTFFSSRDDDEYCTPSHISAYISHLSPTLRVLELGIVDFKFPQGTTRSLTVTPCTSVHSLNMTCVDGAPDLSILLRWFPALASLTVGPLDVSRWSLRDYERFRERNIRSQKDGSWTRLEELRCNADTLYVLGLVCPLRRVVVDHCRASWKRYIAWALSENPPAQLYLSIILAHGPDVMDKLIPESAKEKLTHLTLCLYYMDDKSWRANPGFDTIRQLQSGVLWKVISASIRHLRLSHLRIIVHCDIRGSYNASTHPADYEALIKSIREVDLRAAAAELFHGNSSLKYVFVTSSGYIAETDRIRMNSWLAQEEWLRTGGWRTSGGGGESTRMDHLDSKTVKLVLAREHMELSERDKRRILHHTRG